MYINYKIHLLNSNLMDPWVSWVITDLHNQWSSISTDWEFSINLEIDFQTETTWNIIDHSSFSINCQIPENPENSQLPWCQLCYHWWHHRLSLWQPVVPPAMTKLASWRLSFQTNIITWMYQYEKKKHNSIADAHLFCTNSLISKDWMIFLYILP